MKALFHSLLAGALLLAGCSKDNVDPPKSQLTGRVVYQDQAVGVRSFGSQDLGATDRIPPSMLELWQPGYAFFNKIPVFVQQDGTFTAELFNGHYKLVRSRGNGPWIDNTDSIDVQLNGNMTLDVPVQPYFTIQNAESQKGDTAVAATCNVTKTATKDIDVVTLFISTTSIVDAVNNVNNFDFVNSGRKNGATITSLNTPVSLLAKIPPSFIGKTLYARIGVKAAGVGEYIYSPVQKLE